MKSLPVILALVILSLYGHAQTKPELNQFGEVRTSIQHWSMVHGYTTKLLAENKEAIVKAVGEGMYAEIANHSNLETWPSKYNSIRTFNTNDPRMEEYKVYYITRFAGNVIVRVPYAENLHMPAEYLKADKSDFYFVGFEVFIRNISQCIDAAKVEPSKYPESAFARNIISKGTRAAGADEVDKGLAEEKKTNWKEAMEWYRKAADKGNETGFHNIGILYYNNTTGEYNSKDILEDAVNPGSSRARKYREAMTWFKKAADKGFAPSCYMIGRMYRDGLGVTADKVEARKWLQKAAEKGHAKASEELKAL